MKPADGKSDPRINRRTALKRGAAFALSLSGMELSNTARAQSTEPTVVKIASAPFFDTLSIEALLAAYNASQSSVRLVYERLPSPSDPEALHSELRRRLVDPENAPDIYSLDLVRIGEFAAAGHALPLGEYFDDAEMDKFFEGIVDGCRIGGELMAMPWFADCGMLFYRTDILQAIDRDVPETWDDLVEAATLAVEQGSETGYVWQGGKSEALVCNAVSVIGSNGSTILDRYGRPQIGSSRASHAIQFLHDCVHRHRISPAGVFGWDEEPSRKVFHEGRAAFLRNWGYTWGLAQQSGSPIAGKIGVAPLPRFSWRRKAACLGGYQFAINAASRKKQAAADALAWLTSPETQLQFATIAGLAPTRPDVYDHPTLARDRPFLAQIKDVLSIAISRPKVANYSQLSAVIQDGLSKALKTGEIESALSETELRMEAMTGK